MAGAFHALSVVALLLPGCDRAAKPAPSEEPRRESRSGSVVASAAATTSEAPRPIVPLRPSTAEDAGAEAPEAVPPGSPIIPLRPIELAVYLATPATPALTKDAEQKVRVRFPAAKLLTKPEPLPPPTVVVFAPETADFELPSAPDLAAYGRGLRPAQVSAAARSKGALLLGFLLDADPKFAELRKAQDLALELAQKTGGFVWDDASHELFSAQSWKAARVDGWQGDIPAARRHYTTRFYNDTGERSAVRGRVVTLGLAKLGLPDLVVEAVPVMQSAAIASVVGAVAQLLVEGAEIGADGSLPVDVKTIHHAGARAAALSGAAPNATLRGTVRLAVVDPEEGDADNRLAEVRFDAYPGASDAERQAAAVRGMLGTVPPQMTGGEGEPELRAIAQRAQAKAAGLAASFDKGLGQGSGPGMELYVWVPFAPGGETFAQRWIRVTRWRGGTVQGALNGDLDGSDPAVGGVVEVPEAFIGDYVLRKPDGAREGGESLKLLARGAK